MDFNQVALFNQAVAVTCLAITVLLQIVDALGFIPEPPTHKPRTRRRMASILGPAVLYSFVIVSILHAGDMLRITGMIAVFAAAFTVYTTWLSFANDEWTSPRQDRAAEQSTMDT